MKQFIQRLLLRQQLRRKSDQTTRVLLGFFLLVIVIGTFLLALPVSSRSGQSCGVMVALFTATSATCVTGLSPVDTFTQWSGVGQAVLLLLIQVGGLGYMTLMSMCLFLLHRKLGLRERLVLQQVMALNELDGVIHLLKLVLLGTAIIEGTGALVLILRFLPLMPAGRAVWFGVFHAISAYCNAGFDLMGAYQPGSSFTLFQLDPVVTVTVMILIILGGLGFFVWNDLLLRRFHWTRFSVHTKLVLITTVILIFGGAAALLLVEWNNPGTFGTFSVGGKILSALFQSVTTRTAGFFCVDQAALTGSGKLISILLMFAGGSSGSTAGGIKTVTVALLFLTAVRVLRNRKDIVVFKRKIPVSQVLSAMCIAVLIVSFGIAGGVIVSTVNGVSLGDAVYETVSAICTVGLSTGITAELNAASKLLLIVYMFFGRVGIMTISLAFLSKTPLENTIGRPETRVLIG